MLKDIFTYNIIGDFMYSINIKDLLGLKNINIIDIRRREKYNDNHIPGAINIPKIVLIKDYNKYLEHNKKYYIYCEQGIESIKVCRFLRSIGFDAININGGYQNWILNS